MYSEKLLRKETKGILPQRDERVLIKISLKNGGFWEKQYKQTDIVQKVIDDYKDENNEELPEEYMTDWKHKNQSLKMTDQLKVLLDDEIPTLFIEKKEKIKPLELGEDIIPEIVGKPFYNPFEVFIFHKKDKTLKIQKYDNDLIEKEGLDNYGPSSAYCNGKNYLFISGGEKSNSEILKKFWKIDLDTQEIESIDWKEKKNHSMIYIRGNYVFIVGGNDLKTFYYNMEEGTMNDWGDLNINRIEPSLILISDYLYCFDNVNSKRNIDELTFEKTNITSENGVWEIFKPNLEQFESHKFNQKFFGISKSKDNILFLGGNMDADGDDKANKFNYKYNIRNQAIEISDIPFDEYNFKEKTFLPYKNNVDYILPDFNRHHPEVIFFQKNKNKISIVKYEPNNEKKLRAGRKNNRDFKYNFSMPSFSLPTTENINCNKDIKNIITKENLINENLYIDYENRPSLKLEEDKKKSNTSNSQIDNTIQKDENIDDKNQKDLILKNKASENEYLNDKKTGKIDNQFKFDDNNIDIKKSKDKNDANKDKIYDQDFIYESKINVPDIKINIDKSNQENVNSSDENLQKINIKKPEEGINPNMIDVNVKYPEIKIDANIPNINTTDPKDNLDIHLPMTQNNEIKTPENKINKIDSNASQKEKFPFPGILPGITENEKMKRISSINSNEGPSITAKNGEIKLREININDGKGQIKTGNAPNSNAEVLLNPKKEGDLKIYFKEEGIIRADEKYKKGYYKLKSSDIKISGNIPNSNINSPNGGNKIDIKTKENIKNSDFQINGVIPDIKTSNINTKGPNFNLQSINIESKNPDLSINPQKINMNYEKGDREGNISDFQKISPDIDIKKPELGLKGPKMDISIPNPDIKGKNIGGKIEVNENIPGSQTNLNDKKNSGKIFFDTGIIQPNQKKKTEINLQGAKLDIKGNMPDAKINGPRVDINNLNDSKKLNLKGDKDLLGVIPEIKDKKKLEQNVFIKNPEFKEMINGKLEGPNAELNLKSSKVNDPKIKLHNSKLNGQIGGNIDIEEKNINISGIIPQANAKSKEINIRGPTVSLKDDKSNSGANNEFHIEGIIHPKINKNNEIKYEGTTKGVKISGKAPNLKVDSADLDKNKLNFHGSLNNQNLGPEHEIKGSRKLQYDKMNNIDIQMPKLELKTEGQANLENANKIEFEGGNIGGGINLVNNIPTKLKAKTDEINNRDNKFGINVNFDGGMKQSDIDLENLGKNFISYENSEEKILYNNSNIGGMKRKGKGLPTVGIKTSNFEPSKVDVAGKFESDYVNVNNLKSANVGINGQKVGERIIE